MRLRYFMTAALLLLAGCTKDIHVDRMLLNPTNLIMAVGDTQTLEVRFLADGTDAVEWFSDNSEVATISSSGTVTAVTPGSAKVTARSVKGGLYAVCDVFVRGYKEDLVAGVQLQEHDITLYLGENVQFTATVLPTTAVNQNVRWSSSSTGVAYIDQTGFLRTLLVGTTVVTVTTEEGLFTDSCNVTVLPAFVYIEYVDLPETCHLNVGESVQLEAVIEPEDATNKNVTWTSLDESVLTVTQEGVITGIAPGSTYVKIETEDGNHHDYCLVTVFDPSEQ